LAGFLETLSLNTIELIDFIEISENAIRIPFAQIANLGFRFVKSIS
jgi:hypothetical protein